MKKLYMAFEEKQKIGLADSINFGNMFLMSDCIFYLSRYLAKIEQSYRINFYEVEVDSGKTEQFSPTIAIGCLKKIVKYVGVFNYDATKNK